MAVEEGFIQYTVDVKGADRVRKEFDELADAALAAGKGFERLDKHLDANEKRHGRVVARLRESVKALREYAEMTSKASGANATKTIDERKRAYEEERKQVGLLADELERMVQRRKLDKELEGNVGAANRATDKQDNQNIADTLGREAAARDRLTKALADQARAKKALDEIGDPRKGDIDPARYEQANAALKDYTSATNEATAAQRNMNSVIQDGERGLASQRYALHDLSNAYAIVGGALSGVGIYATVVGSQFQASFANVERTLDPAEFAAGELSEAIDNIRSSLVQLTGQLPLTFAELSEIATIGNQMGIAESDLIDFTSTIARFASVSGMSIEEVSKAFGGFMAQTGLAPKYLENLGSSLAYVSIKSNATEAEILSVSREIAALSTGAGLSADQIVGLAGTLAALRIPAERSRGSLETYFNTLRRAVANGGEDLQNFATVVGVTTDQLDSMVRSGQGAEVLERFITRLNSVDSVAMTSALDALNIRQLRVSNTFTRLSQNVDTFREHMEYAQGSFIQGAELNRQYEITLETLNAQWTIFINGLNGLVNAISGGAIPSLASFMQMVNGVLFSLIDLLERHRWVAYILAFGAAMVTVTGFMLIFRAAVMRGQAALLAYRLMTRLAGADSVAAAGSVRGLAGALLGVEAGARRGAAGLILFRQALVRTGVGALIVGAGFLADKLFNISGGADSASLSMSEYNNITEQARRVSQGAGGGASDLADALGGGGGGGSPSVADAAEKAADKVRLLTDYASDLAGVLSRSFSLRFDSTSAMDAVLTRWNKLREEAERYQAEINKLTADRSLREYWLGVAEMYDDQLRAGQLRAEIADIDKDLAKAQAGASTELRGNSQAAIDNRDVMRGLLNDYQRYIEALAASGASQAFIQSEVDRLNRQFMEQGAALGFSQGELRDYSVAFDDMAKIVAGVPRDVTVKFNGDPALTALAEFSAKLEEAARNAGTAAGGAAADGFGDGLSGGLGDLGDLSGIPIEPDQFIDDDSWKASGRTGGKYWTDQFWNQLQNFGDDFNKWTADLAIGILDIFEPFASMVGIDLTGLKDTVRHELGLAGSLGSAAFDAGFSKGSKIGEVLINGITYQWDEVTNTYHRLGATSSEKMAEGFVQISPTQGVLDDVTYHRDAITGEWFTTGSEAGVNYTEGLDSYADPANLIREKVRLGRPTSNAEMTLLAESMGYTFDRDYSNSSDPIGIILSKIQNGKTLTAEEARALANTDATAYNSKFGLTLNADGKIKDQFNTLDSTAASNAGVRSGNGFWDGVSRALNGFGSWISGLFNPGPSIGSRGSGGRGFSGGGYTGPGHWLEPAGIVHRGEYVIPKKYVNQSTGLPRLDYVQSLQRGKAAPRGTGAGYAGGGHVGAGGTLELGEYTINRLGRQVTVGLRVDRQELASASSSGDTRLARRGSN